mmetsp:Transcript_17918/g.54419  ORF Transcript_17918/g.54419 Transcript_17918/m.54419 type:complete len:268 (+) Transcript_17918:37-840(+)
MYSNGCVPQPHCHRNSNGGTAHCAETPTASHPRRCGRPHRLFANRHPNAHCEGHRGGSGAAAAGAGLPVRWHPRLWLPTPSFCRLVAGSCVRGLAAELPEHAIEHGGVPSKAPCKPLPPGVNHFVWQEGCQHSCHLCWRRVADPRQAPQHAVPHAQAVCERQDLQRIHGRQHARVGVLQHGLHGRRVLLELDAHGAGRGTGRGPLQHVGQDLALDGEHRAVHQDLPPWTFWGAGHDDQVREVPGQPHPAGSVQRLVSTHSRLHLHLP